MDPELFSRLPVSPEVLSVLIGVVLLVAGRRIFWLTLGAAAFTAGALLSTYLPVEMKAEGRLLLALISGLLGILLASFIRRTGVAVGGLVIGALLGLYAAQAYDPGAGAAALLGAAIGALLGWALARRLIEAALILLSSVMGGLLVVQSLPLEQPLAGAVLVGLTLIGVGLQSRSRRRKG